MNPVRYSVVVEGLTKSYGSLRAIAGISFAFAPGEIVGFLGPNGAGKSTTMRILTGLLNASSGIATVMGLPVASQPEKISRCIGYMPENNPLPEDLRVGDYLRLRARLKGLSGARLRSELTRVCEICNLDRKTRRKPIRALSKGFRQRVGIADALLASPPIVILDEPTIGLDPHQVRAFRELINNLRGSHTVIVSSHILSEIERICDRCVIINRGQVVAQGTPAELRATFLPGAIYELRCRGTIPDPEGVFAPVAPGISIGDTEVLADGVHRILLNSTDTGNLVPGLLTTVGLIPGVEIIGISRVEASLDDIFVAATRREGGNLVA